MCGHHALASNVHPHDVKAYPYHRSPEGAAANARSVQQFAERIQERRALVFEGIGTKMAKPPALPDRLPRSSAAHVIGNLGN
jgi:hypothetical protein